MSPMSHAPVVAGASVGAEVLEGPGGSARRQSRLLERASGEEQLGRWRVLGRGHHHALGCDAVCVSETFEAPHFERDALGEVEGHVFALHVVQGGLEQSAGLRCPVSYLTTQLDAAPLPRKRHARLAGAVSQREGCCELTLSSVALKLFPQIDSEPTAPVIDAIGPEPCKTHASTADRLH